MFNPLLLGLFVGLFVGTNFGVLLMALMATAKRSDMVKMELER